MLAIQFFSKEDLAKELKERGCKVVRIDTYERQTKDHNFRKVVVEASAVVNSVPLFYRYIAGLRLVYDEVPDDVKRAAKVHEAILTNYFKKQGFDVRKGVVVTENLPKVDSKIIECLNFLDQVED